MRSLYLLYACFIVAIVYCGNEGMHMTLTHSGYAKIGDTVLSKVYGKPIPIPDIDNQFVECKGKCYLSLHDATATGFTCERAIYTMEEGKLGFGLKNCKIAVNQASWRFKRSTFPSFSCHGKVSLQVTDLTVNVILKVVYFDKALNITTASATVHIESDHLTFDHGDCDFELNLIKGLLESMIKKQVNGKLSDTLPGIIDGALASHEIPQVIPIPLYDLNLVIPVGDTPPPAVTHEALEVGLLGKFELAKPNIPPFTQDPPDLVNLPTTHDMIGLTLSSYTFNSLFHAAYYNNSLQHTWNETFFGIAGSLSLSANKPPVSKMYSNGTVSMLLSANINVTIPALDSWALFSTSVELPFVPNIKGSSLHVTLLNDTISTLDVTVIISHNKFPPVDLRAFADVIEMGVATFVIPMANEYLAPGFPITPLDGISLVNAKTVYGDGYILFDGSFETQERM